jgi:SAM-dependent methyltransferase
MTEVIDIMPGGRVMIGTSDEVRADIRALPFKNLARIHATHILEAFPDASIVPALKSCRRALRPGGSLELYMADLPWLLGKFLGAHGQGEKWSHWAKLIYEPQDGQWSRSGFSTHRIVACLTAAGFREIRVRRRRHKPCDRNVEVYALAIS